MSEDFRVDIPGYTPTGMGVNLKLNNVTHAFLNLLFKNPIKYYTFEIHGAKRWGKTSTGIKLCSLYHKYHGLKTFFLNEPEKSQELLKNAKPPVDWIVPVDDFYDCFHGCAYIDESLFAATNAKDAHTKESRLFEQVSTLSGQNQLELIVGSVRPFDILRGTRTQTDFKIFKHMPIGFLDEEYPKWISKYGLEEQLVHLDYTEAIIRSDIDFPGLQHGIGKITKWTLPSFWTPELSELWQGRVIVTQIDKDEIARAAINIGFTVKSNLDIRILKGWIDKEYEDLELTPTNKDAIINRMALLLKLDGKLEKEPKSKVKKETDNSDSKWTDEGFEENILQTLPDFLDLWDSTKVELLARLRNIFKDQDVKEGKGYIIPPRLDVHGDPAMNPDVLGVLKDSSIGVVNAKNWDWNNCDCIYTHKKMKSELGWYIRLRDMGFKEPITVMLFLHHKVTGQIFKYIVPIEKAIHGTLRIVLPDVEERRDNV